MSKCPDLAILTAISVDTVAETSESISKDLYTKLWSFVPQSGTSPKAADHWDSFTAEEQAELIRLDGEQ